MHDRKAFLGHVSRLSFDMYSASQLDRVLPGGRFSRNFGGIFDSPVDYASIFLRIGSGRVEANGIADNNVINLKRIFRILT